MKFSLLSVLWDCKISGPISTILPPHNFLFWYDMNKFYLHYLAPSRPILFWHEYMCIYIYIYICIFWVELWCAFVLELISISFVCVFVSQKKKKKTSLSTSLSTIQFLYPSLTLINKVVKIGILHKIVKGRWNRGL